MSAGGGIVGTAAKVVLGGTAVLALVSVPLAVAWNTTAIKAGAVTVGATVENAENVDDWMAEGRDAVSADSPEADTPEGDGEQ